MEPMTSSYPSNIMSPPTGTEPAPGSKFPAATATSGGPPPMPSHYMHSGASGASGIIRSTPGGRLASFIALGFYLIGTLFVIINLGWWSHNATITSKRGLWDDWLIILLLLFWVIALTASGATLSKRGSPVFIQLFFTVVIYMYLTFWGSNMIDACHVDASFVDDSDACSFAWVGFVGYWLVFITQMVFLIFLAEDFRATTV